MENIVITEQGKQLMSKVISETESMTFTKIAVSDYDYSGIELPNISELQSVKQTAIISKTSRTDGKTVEILAAINNEQIPESYYVRTLGVYVKDSSENEILYGISISGENPDYMPAYEGKTLSGVSYRINVAVEDSEYITVNVNPAAVPTIMQVEDIDTAFREHTEDKVSHITAVERKKWDAVTEKVGEHTVKTDVPEDAKFTDTWRPQPDWDATSGESMIKNKPYSKLEIEAHPNYIGEINYVYCNNNTVIIEFNDTQYKWNESKKQRFVPQGSIFKVTKSIEYQIPYSHGIFWTCNSEIGYFELTLPVYVTYSGSEGECTIIESSDEIANPVGESVLMEDGCMYKCFEGVNFQGGIRGINYILKSSDIVNNLVTTKEGYALDARQGEALDGKITELKKSVSDGKSAIASAITNAGISTASDASFATMSSNIAKVRTDTTYTDKSRIIYGETAYVQGKKVTGTMPSYRGNIWYFGGFANFIGNENYSMWTGGRCSLYLAVIRHIKMTFSLTGSSGNNNTPTTSTEQDGYGVVRFDSHGNDGYIQCFASNEQTIDLEGYDKILVRVAVNSDVYAGSYFLRGWIGLTDSRSGDTSSEGQSEMIAAAMYNSTSKDKWEYFEYVLDVANLTGKKYMKVSMTHSGVINIDSCTFLPKREF